LITEISGEEQVGYAENWQKILEKEQVGYAEDKQESFCEKAKK
jgi:hypothetical protein